MSARETPSFAVRAAKQEDGQRLYEIHRAALGPYVAKIWGWDDAWQAEAFAKNFDPKSVRVVEELGQVVGFYQLNDEGEAVVLSKIEIEPGCQQRGVGTRIIIDVLAEARARGQVVRLQVFKINHRAHALYQRLGFHDTGETPTHVQMTAPAPT
jgi:ribosomal protein S18 acetylase RimI-like enzyme